MPPPPSPSSASLLKKVNHIIHTHWSRPTYPCHDTPLLSRLRLLSATLHPSPTLMTRLKVEQDMCNPYGALHGGAFAMIFDVVTSLSIVLVSRPPASPSESAGSGEGGGGEEGEEGSKEVGVKGEREGGKGFWPFPGVTRHLDIVYLGRVEEGEEVEVWAEIVRIGRRLCQVRGVMRRVSEEGKEGQGEVVATCEHGKVWVEGRL